MNVNEMMLKYPEYKYSLFTPGGYVYLTLEEVKSLLSGNVVNANSGCSGYDREMEADELLPGRVMSVRWEGGVCYMMVAYSDDMRFIEEVQKMVREHEQEKKVISQMEAEYKNYGSGLMEKPSSYLIEHSEEITVTKYIYNELASEGKFTEYADYILQLENPNKDLVNDWLTEADDGNHKKLSRCLHRKAVYDDMEPEMKMNF